VNNFIDLQLLNKLTESRESITDLSDRLQRLEAGVFKMALLLEDLDAATIKLLDRLDDFENRLRRKI